MATGDTAIDPVASLDNKFGDAPRGEESLPSDLKTDNLSPGGESCIQQKPSSQDVDSTLFSEPIQHEDHNYCFSESSTATHETSSSFVKEKIEESENKVVKDHSSNLTSELRSAIEKFYIYSGQSPLDSDERLQPCVYEIRKIINDILSVKKIEETNLSDDEHCLQTHLDLIQSMEVVAENLQCYEDQAESEMNEERQVFLKQKLHQIMSKLENISTRTQVSANEIEEHNVDSSEVVDKTAPRFSTSENLEETETTPRIEKPKPPSVMERISDSEEEYVENIIEPSCESDIEEADDERSKFIEFEPVCFTPGNKHVNPSISEQFQHESLPTCSATCSSILIDPKDSNYEKQWEAIKQSEKALKNKTFLSSKMKSKGMNELRGSYSDEQDYIMREEALKMDSSAGTAKKASGDAKPKSEAVMERKASEIERPRGAQSLLNLKSDEDHQWRVSSEWNKEEEKQERKLKKQHFFDAIRKVGTYYSHRREDRPFASFSRSDFSKELRAKMSASLDYRKLGILRSSASKHKDTDRKEDTPDVKSSKSRTLGKNDLNFDEIVSVPEDPTSSNAPTDEKKPGKVMKRFRKLLSSMKKSQSSQESDTTIVL